MVDTEGDADPRYIRNRQDWTDVLASRAAVLLLMSGHADCIVAVYYGECLRSVLGGAVWPPRARSYCRLGLGGPGHAAQGALPLVIGVRTWR